MSESTARDGPERGEQHVRPRVVVVRCSTRSCEVAAKGVPVVNLVGYVVVCKGRLEKNEQCVKTETVSASCLGRKG